MDRMNIATAPHRNSLHWQQSTISWDELVLWMLEPADTKEAGNYILGTLAETTVSHRDTGDCCGLHRSREAIVSRDALTLDADTPAEDFLERVRALGVRALVHTTYSATPEKPRYRVIIPLSRSVTPAEYTAEVAEVMAAVGESSFDPGSSQAERYMFRPAGDHFRYEVINGPVREPAAVVDPFAAMPGTKRDPLELPGIVGAFNRVYTDLNALIAAYDLPYEAAGDRWTLRDSEAAPGVSELATGLWWSSHSTDPAHGHAQTAFDLMRLHRFGQEDSKTAPDTPITERPSFAAATAMAEADDAVRLEALEADFGPSSPLVVLGYDPDSVKDRDVAMQLAERDLRDSFRYTDERGWFRWDGTRWATTTATTLVTPLTESIRDLAREWAASGKTAADVQKVVGLLDQPRIKRLVEMLKSVLLVPSSVFDSRPELLNVGNGTVDLRSGELRPHAREDYITKVTPVRYIEGATHSDWDTALTAMRDDVVGWMQVRIGQAATGHRTPDDLMPVLQGGGANGKTTFTGAISEALGEHAVFLSERVLLSNPGDHPTEVMTLQGARFALLEETPEGQHLNVKRLKSLVGTPTITARRMRQDDETFTSTHSLFLTTNYNLNVTETDTGTWRRLALVRFPYTYSATAQGEGVRTPDPQLRTRMEVSPSGQHEAVLAWIVAGAVEWYAAGGVLPPAPASVVEDTEEWRADADPIFSYVNERLEFDPEASVMVTEVYEDFTNYLTANGRPSWSLKTFSARFGGHALVAGQGVSKSQVRATQVSLSRLDPLTAAPEGQFRVWKGVKFAR